MLPDLWSSLRALTPARIAPGRAGGSLPTGAVLDFQLAHAQARDAVHHHPDLEGLASRLRETGVDAIGVNSLVPDRATYLKRPDLGRRVHPADADRLDRAAGQFDAVVVIADGLSGLAVERHAVPLALGVLARLSALSWRVAPVIVARYGRVAIGDDVAQRLGGRLVAVLIGERPGLSSPDSLGVYLTWAPRVGRTDAERNCLSNIRTAGLPVAVAVDKLVWLLTEATRRKLSGIELKEGADGRIPG